MFAVRCFFLLCWCAATASAGELPATRTAAAPEFFLVAGVEEETVTFERPRVGDLSDKKVVRVKDMVVRGTDGEAIPPAKWRQALVAGSVVVVSADDRPVDAAYARVLKAGALLITATVPPALRLFAPRRGVGADVGKVVFSWQSEGTGLRGESAVLSYRSEAAGPWHRIAGGLPNSGEYAWRPPAVLPVVMFLRIEVSEADGAVLPAQTLKGLQIDRYLTAE
jgi:hypothetical protein